jgi:hypothetical protein
MVSHLKDFFRYWREFAAQFGSDCYDSWKSELRSTVFIAALIYILTVSNDTSAKDAFIVTMKSCGILFAAWMIWHLIRTPWKLDQKKEKKIENATRALQERASLVVEQLNIQNIHSTQVTPHPSEGPSRLGMRVIYLSPPFLRGGPPDLDVEFRLHLLSGRPPSSLSIRPVHSERGSYSIRFQPLPFLTRDQEETIKFEVWKLDTPPSSKSRTLRSGWGDLLAEFVLASQVEGSISTSPIIVNFMDENEYKEQRFRLTFNPNTRELGIIDEYPDFVIDNTLCAALQERM